MRKFLLLLVLAAAGHGQSIMLIMGSGVTGTVATPTDSPGAGTYTTSSSVTLSTGTSGAAICYRTDGTAPTAAVTGTCDSPAVTYSGAFSITATSTVKAIATKAGYTNSGVLTSTYTIQAATPTTSNSGGSCTGSDGAGWSCSGSTTVTLASATSGVTFCHREDGTNPAATTPGTCDAGSTTGTSVSVSSTATIKALATKSGLTNSSILSVTYTISVAPITFVQEASNTSPANNCDGINGTSFTCVLPAAPTNGNTLLLNIIGADTTCDFTQTGASIVTTGVTWSRIAGARVVGPATVNAAGLVEEAWVGKVTSGSASATTTLTWQTNGGSHCFAGAASITEWSGINTTTPVDGTAATSSGTGTAVSSGSYTSSVNNVLLLALFGDQRGGNDCGIFTYPSGYTSKNCFTTSSLGWITTTGTSYKLTNTAGSQSFSATIGASADWTAIMVGLKQ